MVKQRSTKHYTENWTHVLLKGKQFLLCKVLRQANFSIIAYLLQIIITNMI